jgi:hypothetical protein
VAPVIVIGRSATPRQLATRSVPPSTMSLLGLVRHLARVENARALYADPEFNAVVQVHGDDVEVRDIVVHLVEEYARHLGHADLLRECIDGRTGQ